MVRQARYYQDDLALVHHLGFGFHADACALGILSLLEPIRACGGLVVEVGCGSGGLTRHLIAAGHRVIATDGSPAMLDLARVHVPDAEEIRQIVLPDDPIPPADAVVSVGHVLNYLPDEASLYRGLAAVARAVRPGGLLAIDLCDLEYGEARRHEAATSRVADKWAIVSTHSLPSPTRFVREITTFLRNDDGSWRRQDERHENVLLDTSLVPDFLRARGLEATVAAAFGQELLPQGLVAVIGRRPSR